MAAHRRAALERIVAASRAALGEATFTAAWEAGQAWPLEQAVAEATAIAAAIAVHPS